MCMSAQSIIHKDACGWTWLAYSPDLNLNTLGLLVQNQGVTSQMCMLRIVKYLYEHIVYVQCATKTEETLLKRNQFKLYEGENAFAMFA